MSVGFLFRLILGELKLVWVTVHGLYGAPK